MSRRARRVERPGARVAVVAEIEDDADAGRGDGVEVGGGQRTELVRAEHTAEAHLRALIDPATAEIAQG
jgi:hypothetical protein